MPRDPVRSCPNSSALFRIHGRLRLASFICERVRQDPRRSHWLASLSATKSRLVLLLSYQEMRVLTWALCHPAAARNNSPSRPRSFFARSSRGIRFSSATNRSRARHLDQFAAETEPLNIIAPINISNCIDSNLKFVAGVLFEHVFQRNYLFGR